VRGVGCSKGAETAANDAAREPRARGRAGDEEARKERHTYERSILAIGGKGRLGRRVLSHEAARHRQSLDGRPRNTQERTTLRCGRETNQRSSSVPSNRRGSKGI
jgi:hypothetical protein